MKKISTSAGTAALAHVVRRKMAEKLRIGGEDGGVLRAEVEMAPSVRAFS